MKKIIQYISIVVVILLTVSVQAQTGQAYEMMVKGVKVIVQPSGNDIVVIQTIVKGGVENYTADKAGIESLAFTALTECGTSTDDKNSFKNKLDKVSAEMYGSTDMDYGDFNLNCIKSDFETVWPLYVAALTTPAFDAKEFERIKQDAINNIRSNESNPDVAIDNMAKQTAFAGKSYSKNPNGTVSSVSALSVEATQKYWQSIFTKSRLAIVIVADLDRKIIEEKVQELLSKVPSGTAFNSTKSSYSTSANSFKPQQRDNATNYVQGITGGPKPGSPDYNAFVLAMRIFSSKHFIEIRTKNGLSYAPGAWFSGGNLSYSNIYVTTTEPDKYIAVARQLIDRLKQEGFTQEDLKNEKTGYVTGIFYQQETNEAQASSLAHNEVIHGNWRRNITIKDDIKKVTLADINNAFKKYITNITWVYQGNSKKVNPTLYTQKPNPKIPEEKKGF